MITLFDGHILGLSSDDLKVVVHHFHHAVQRLDSFLFCNLYVVVLLFEIFDVALLFKIFKCLSWFTCFILLIALPDDFHFTNFFWELCIHVVDLGLLASLVDIVFALGLPFLLKLIVDSLEELSVLG